MENASILLATQQETGCLRARQPNAKMGLLALASIGAEPVRIMAVSNSGSNLRGRKWRIDWTRNTGVKYFVTIGDALMEA